MATKTGGGANHLTVQESKNIKLGQVGSIFTDNATTAITPPTGTVFIAIQALFADITFDSSGGLVAEDPDKYINTEQASTGGGGSGGVQMDVNNTLPAGTTIYGRWTSINLAGGASGIVAYIGA